MSSKAKKQSKPRNKAPNQHKPRNKQLVVYNPDQVQEGVYTSELGQLLKNHIDEKVKPFRNDCRKIARGELELTPVLKSTKEKQESKPKRKQQKSIKLATKTISFDFLGDQEALRRFPGIESVFPKLHDWELRGVKRNLGDTCDTYYSHETLGTKELRSINEVVNHLLPQGYPKLHCNKGKRKENEVKDENTNPESREKRKRRKGENKVKVLFLGSSSSSSFFEKNKEKSIILKEVSAAGSSNVKEVSRKRKNNVFLGSSSSSTSQKNKEKSIILREVPAESSEEQIVIHVDDVERLEDMLNSCADNDKCMVAVSNKMDEDLDEIIEEFPEYDDLANQFFN